MGNKLIRLSYNITYNTPTYGNRNKLVVNQRTEKINDFYITESKWNFTTNHLGTHIDVPKHFVNEGLSVTDFEEDFWVFNNVELIDIPKEKGELIEGYEIVNKIHNPLKIELLLIRTGYEKFRNSDKYWNDNPGISPEAAKLIREKLPNLRGLGFDFISLTSYRFRNEGKMAHYNIFKNNTPFIVIEDMKLTSASEKKFSVIVSPIFVEKADGSPVNVFQVIENE